MSNKYEIKDIEEFTQSARRLVFAGFGKSVEETKDEFTNMLQQLSKEEEQEMDNVLSQKESILIVESFAEKQTNKKTKRQRFLVNEKIFTAILEALNSRLVSNILSNLVHKGLIESAYDEKLNDFVFWVKEDDNKKNDT
jgi:hypothetical protein